MFWQKLFGSKTDIDTDSKKIAELMTRGVEDVLIRESLEKKLKSGRQLRVKLGFDPTGDKIHIGRAIVLHKLRAFQDLGHKIVFIVGDYTALIADPSDKLEKRPMLSKEKIHKNLKNYKAQVGKIIDVNKAEFVYNSSWLSKLDLNEIGELADSFTVDQMLSRRNFAERKEKKQEISVRELFYPLMQGYDSVAVRSDVEIGGFDQLFNLKAGRIIQKYFKQAEQDILTTSMLEGTDGRKMSTSWGNVINIVDEPNDMYGKVMSLKDELIPKYFLLTTKVTESYVKEIEDKIKSGSNPKELKMELAREIVTLYHGQEQALKAEAEFVSIFSRKSAPSDLREESVNKGVSLRETLVDLMIVTSKSEFGRLVDQGAIERMETGEKVTDPYAKIEETSTYRIGKKQFIKIIVRQ